MKIKNLKIFALILCGILLSMSQPTWGQNVLLKGKTVDYYNSKKVKNVTISIYSNDSLITKTISKGKYKIKIQTKGILKVVFSKEGFIEKHFLINTTGLPEYYLDKKYSVSAEVSMTKYDKYMEVSKIQNAVGYVYFNKKYQGFIWDPEYTKRAQVAMDAQIFPLDEIIKLDSALNKNTKTYFFQRGLNYYINVKTNPEQFFKESKHQPSRSKIKTPVQQGYYYGKLTNALLQEDLNSSNHCLKAILNSEFQYGSIAEGLKDCKRMDTLVLNNKYAATGYWMNLVNYADTSEIIKFTNIAHSIKILEKQFVSIEMTDAELSFYADFKKVSKASEVLYQRIKNSTQSEIKDPKFYEYALRDFREKVRLLARNNDLTKD